MEENEIYLAFKRTKYCGQFTENDIEKKVVAVGWVNKQRNLGNLVFIDLRDRTGIIQLVVDEENTDKISFKNALNSHAEYILAGYGTLRKRKEKNEKIKTGSIEIYIEKLQIVAKSKTPPFEIRKNEETNMELRLKYRYLDLRNENMQRIFLLRHKITKLARDFFDRNGFIEIETPILIKSTPEGARDYIVPSRINKGKFYALPQSPQLYKQILMVSGFDKYFQIAKCFRDEDLRADRQPEFSQIDIEMSFVEEKDIMKINEEFIKTLFLKILNIKIKTPFKKLSYEEAMNRFGTDKPDVRFSMELINITDGLLNCKFKVFSDICKKGAIYAINLKNKANSISRKFIDKLTDFVKTYKAKGLLYTRITDEKTSNYEKFLSEKEIEYIYEKSKATKNDAIFIIADKDKTICQTAMGFLRQFLAKEFSLYNENEFSFLWVTNFPLFEYSEEEKRYISKHHPFTAISDEDLTKLEISPKTCKAKAYDLVLNGSEIGGGSIRIHSPEIQEKVFKTLKLSPEEIETKFGFLVEALKFGAPPHGGMAYGLDRLVMIMLNKKTIRDVIAFPKVQTACELLTNSPSYIEKSQLEDVHIKIE